MDVLSSTLLRWPDYAGNAMLTTLGNLQEDTSAGLLFVDWSTGSTLQLTGDAVVVWGTERSVEFAVRDVVEIDGASPLTWA